MQEITIQSDLVLKFDELTEEIDQLISDEVDILFDDLKQIGEKIKITSNFKIGIMAPRKTGYGWMIHMKAKYSSILWDGRDETLKQGSKGWYYGGEPMLKKMGNDIRRKTDAISK